MTKQELYTVTYRGKEYDSFSKLLKQENDFNPDEIKFIFDENKFAKELGKNLKAHRISNDHTQKSLAEKLNTPAMKISSQEQGVHLPSFIALKKYCQELQTKEDTLFPIEISQETFDYDKKMYGVAFFRDMKATEYKEAALEAVRGISGIVNKQILKELEKEVNNCLKRISILDDTETNEKYTEKYSALLGARLQMLREINGFSIAYVAEVTHISKTTLRYIEMGKRTPSFDFIYRLGFIYGRKISTIIPGSSSTEDFHDFVLEMYITELLSKIENEKLLECANECIRAIFNVDRTAVLKASFNA